MADANLIARSATALAADIAGGTVTAEECIRAYLDRIAAVEGQVQAFAHFDPEHALTQARQCDEWRRSGRPLGPLHGVPVGIKDIIDTADYPTECGSPSFAGRRPRTDATVVAQLRAAGAVILAKTVTTEFAYFTPRKTRNPHDLERTPGGSSSGSAAAVAAGMLPLALGSQTNGSMIRPASFCGVFGIKPSHGTVSRAGVLPLSRTLDHIGAYARSLEDLALILDVIAGYDPQDPDTRPLAPRNFRAVAAENFPHPPRLAFVRTPIWDKADAYSRAAFEAFAARLGENCVTIDLPERFAAAWEAQHVIMASEMTHNLGSTADNGGELVSKVFHDLMEDGRKIPAVRYLDAIAEGRSLREAIEPLFQQECSAIITPATMGVAPKGIDTTGNPMFCTLWTLLGLPAISLPLLEHEGMPIGVQLVGAYGDDARLIRHARWLVETVRSQPRS